MPGVTALPAGAQGQFQQAERALGVTDPIVDVWLDGGDVTTLDFSDFGAPVTITVPPPSQVMSESQLEQARGARRSG